MDPGLIIKIGSLGSFNILVAILRLITKEELEESVELELE